MVPLLYPQFLPTEANMEVQQHHSLLGSHHPIKMLTLLYLEALSFLLSLTGCGGVLADSEGSFSSPNHPGSYPPNLLCVWVIRVPPPSVVQIHISSLAVEGPSPCLFDWLEVQEQIEQSSVVTRLAKPQQLSPRVKYLADTTA